MLDVSQGVSEMATEQLEAETCTLAAQLAAATCRFLLLVGELERREAWRAWGCRSTAHWLSWQCGLGLHTAREHVRVGVALDGLPEVRAAFARGELSYSKVRALTRVAKPEVERELIEFAQVATAAQVEKTVAAYRGVVHNVTGRDPIPTAVRRTFNDDGTVTITAAHLDADSAARVWAMLEHERAAAISTENVSAETSRAAALDRLARTYLEPDGHKAPATELVVHTDVDVTSGVEQGSGFGLTVDAVRRLSCDAWVRKVRDDVDAGRRRRTVPRRLRRALMRRDGDRCRFPGCDQRHYLQAHHIVHWKDGGSTDLANLAPLCPFHHKLIHEGNWTIEGDPARLLTFRSPEGRAVSEDQRRHATSDWRIVKLRHRTVDGRAINTAHGERLDLHWTISALCCLVPPDRN
jgi:hypothetical protein